MPNQSPNLDTLFHALADPTRRAVVERLTRGPAAMTELAAPFDMALPSFLQHLRVLERCGLVSSRKAGRVRTYTLKPQRLEKAEGWLQKQKMIWDKRLDQLDAYVLAMKDAQK